MNQFRLLLALPLIMALFLAIEVPFVVGQGGEELTDYYFEDTLVRETFLALSNGRTLSPDLKKRLRVALTEKTCKPGRIRVTLNTKLATDWGIQLRSRSPIGEDILKEVHPALQRATGDVACDSNIAVSSIR